MVKKRIFLFTICTLFLLPFCAVAQNADNVQFLPVSDWQKMQEKQNPSSIFASAVFKVFYAAFKGIDEKYIKPVSFAELIVSGLNELDSVDSSLVTTLSGNNIIISHEGSLIKSIPFKAEDNSEKWAKTLTSAILVIREKSQKIAVLSQEDLYKAIFGGILAKLDENSKYFSKAEALDKKANHHGLMTADGIITKNNTEFAFLEENIALITINSFDSNTEEIVANILGNLYKDTKGIVIDLSGSNGGILSQAADVADLFLSQGTLFKVRGRNPAANKTYKAGKEMLYKGPVAIIIDHNTKSSSEVFAMAMQEGKRAIVIGETSFGKGTSQTPIALPNGGELMLSWGYIYSGKDVPLNDKGVAPDIAFTAPTPDILHEKSLSEAIKWLDEP